MRKLFTVAIAATCGFCLLVFAYSFDWRLLYSAVAIALFGSASAMVAVIVKRNRNRRTQGAESGRALRDQQVLSATMPASPRGVSPIDSDADTED